MGALWAAACSLAILGAVAQLGSDPNKLLEEADRLAWLRAWGRAEPLFTQARKLFGDRGDQPNALYAEISAFRGQLPRMAVPEASARLAAYLEHPLVQGDYRLRLRCLVIKGETDEDLDPSVAGESWRQAQALAEELGDAAWANRAKGELGVLAFLQGDVGASVIGLGQAIKVAQTNGDASSLVRWLTLFGHGYMQLGRPQDALDFYDRALKVARTVPELQFPVMTYVGRSKALIGLGRADEADAMVVVSLSLTRQSLPRRTDVGVFLTPADRRSVLDKVLAAIDTKFMGPDVDTRTLREHHEAPVLDAQTGEAFEAAMNAMLKDLRVSHAGFFHEATPRTAGRVAIAATLTRAETSDGERWVFQDVHPGGAAATAGVRPGDVLLSVGDKELIPPQATPFALGERYELTLRRADGATARSTVVGTEAQRQAATDSRAESGGHGIAPRRRNWCCPRQHVSRHSRYGLQRQRRDGLQLFADRADPWTVHAVTSQRYARVHHDELAGRVLDLMGEHPAWHLPLGYKDGVFGAERVPSGAYLGDRDMFLFLVDGNRALDDPTDRSQAGMFRGFILRNSDVGAAALTLDLFLFRAVCGNHIIWGFHHLAGFRRRHVGASIHEAWADSLESVRAVLDASLDDDRAMLLRATTQELGASREEVLDTVTARLDLSRKLADEAYGLAERTSRIRARSGATCRG